jgi:SAM-dependent methyltransferase
MKEFPVRLIDFIQCNKGCGSLEMVGAKTGATSIQEGALRCPDCMSTYRIRDGILEMLDLTHPIDPRSLFELHKRDEIAQESGEVPIPGNESDDISEVTSTLKRLGDRREKSILELGCGTGRFTRELVKDCAYVMAVDFSRSSLLVNTGRMPDNEKVGFIIADVSRLRLKANSFDLALSTLYSNIPDPEARSASTRSVHHALKPQGKYVLSAHHHDPREILYGRSAVGTYENGIFYQKFKAQSIRNEMLTVFPKVKTETICIWVPYISRINRIRSFVSSASETIPFLNRLGSLLLATATKC